MWGSDGNSLQYDQKNLQPRIVTERVFSNPSFRLNSSDVPKYFSDPLSNPDL